MSIAKSAAAAVIAATLSLSGAQASLLYVNDGQGSIGTLDTDTGETTFITRNIVLTDIAFSPEGVLYGITFGALYTIDVDTGAFSRVGSVGPYSVNALVFGTDGTLYASGGSTGLLTLDPATGQATPVGGSWSSAGDLAFVAGQLYVSSASNDLLAVDTDTGAATTIGAIGFPNVFGMATDTDGTLFGLSGASLLEIDPATGLGTLIAASGFSNVFGTTFFAEAVIPDMPMGEIPLPGAALLFGTGAVALRRRRANRSL